MTLHHGDCLDVMPTLDAESVDAVVTDPPYGLGFMGKAWDTHGMKARTAAQHNSILPAGGQAAVTWEPTGFQSWCQAWATEAYRVAKPSAYLLAFGGTRTVHRMACAIEDAGWIIRDMLVWGYASGFPKSKASLKPAWEPIVMARKPGPLRPLAIDACRIGTEEVISLKGLGDNRNLNDDGWKGIGQRPEPTTNLGRWPANLILTDPIFDGDIEGVVGGGWQESTPFVGAWAPRGAFPIDNPNPTVYGDAGTYSRFFILPKAGRADREPLMGGLKSCPTCRSTDPSLYDARMRSMCGDPWHATTLRKQVVRITEGHGRGPLNTSKGDGTGIRENRPRTNHHPTVKPVELMRHLVRLVTPQGGTVLDPFLGSGTTGLAAEMEGFGWIGIEREAEYVAIAEARLNGVQRGLGLVG